MKKTFTVNISGQVFHVDEDAFDVLQQYLNSLKSHFSKKEGGFEIVEDIESRIAELMNERTSLSKQAITLTDVNEIIAQLGQPFEIDDEETNEPEEKANSTSETHYRGQKRFYRDPDHKVIGGVCSGLASYFNIDPVIIRIAFAVSFFIAGSSFWVYVILWIAIPEAKTTAEKLEMSGEPINVGNIEKKIKKEFNGIKNKFGSLSNDAKDAVNNVRTNVQPKTAFENILVVIGDIFVLFGKVLGILFGLFFVFLGVVISFGLLISLFSFSSSIEISSFGFHSFSIPQLLNLISTSASVKTSAIIGITIFVGLPMIMLIYSGIKLIFGWKFEIKYLGLSVFLGWLLSGVLLAIVGFGLFNDFSKTNSTNITVPINQPQNTLYIDLALDSIPSNIIVDNGSEDMLMTIMADKNEKFYLGIPEIHYRVAEDNDFKVVIRKSARGKSQLEVRNRINEIEYNVTQMADTIVVNPLFYWSKKDVWRNQSVHVTIYCPKGKNIFLKQDLTKLYTLNHYYCDIDSFVNKSVGVNSEGLFVDTLKISPIDTLVKKP